MRLRLQRARLNLQAELIAEAGDTFFFVLSVDEEVFFSLLCFGAACESDFNRYWIVFAVRQFCCQDSIAAGFGSDYCCCLVCCFHRSFPCLCRVSVG